MIFFDVEALEVERKYRNIKPARLSLMLTEKKKDRPPRANLWRELLENGGMCQSLENASLIVNWYGSIGCVQHCDKRAWEELENRLEEYQEEQRYIAEREFNCY